MTLICIGILVFKGVCVGLYPLELDCVHTMPAHFENGENVTVAKFEPVFTRYRNNLKTVESDGKKIVARL